MASPPEFRYHYIRSDTSDLQIVAAELRAIAPPSVTEIIPSYENIMVEYVPTRLSRAQLETLITQAERKAQTYDSPAGRLVEVPVRYDGEDLPALSEWLGMSEATIVRLHSEREYRVSGLGFTPGFPFLSTVDARLRVPRRGVPRPQVPANTVAMADFQTGIYPSATPGGWHLLGQALTAVYDPHREEPFLIQPGDRVRFVPSSGATPPAPTPLSLLPPAPDYPVLRVVEPGRLDLVVDAGRFGFAHYGLARSGPHDPIAAGIANRLVGNPPGTTVLETHVRGPVFSVLTHAVLASAGDGFNIRLNNREIPPHNSFAVQPGDEIGVHFTGGQLAYLAIAGGVQSNAFMGSMAVDINGHIGRVLQVGDTLGAATRRVAWPNRVFIPHRWNPRAIRVPIVPGPQFSKEAMRALTAHPYQVESGNRMGLLLSGNTVPGGQISSEGNPLGAIQITTSGKPIVLLQDRGSIGGYHKPAIIPTRYLPRLAYVVPGQMIQFSMLSPSW